MTESFLRHILLRPESSYQEVLAVTFTNLATGELKERFFKELDTLAKDPHSSPFYTTFHRLYPNDDLLSDLARRALKEILFDYGGLRVKTIDSFFQDIIHALAIELKQRPSTRIELSTTQILELAVERLFDAPSVDAQKAIQRFLEQREDRSVRALRSSLSRFAEQLYNEQIQELDFKGVDIFNPDTYRSFVLAVEGKVKKIQGQIIQQVESFRRESQSCGVMVFPGKSRSPLTRLVDTQYSQPTIGQSDSFITQTTWEKYLKDGRIEDTLSESYAKDLEETFVTSFYQIIKSYADLNTLQVCIEQGYELQLLGEIQRNVKLVVEELGVTLLDDAKRLIRRLVGQPGSTEFIYERLGTSLRHHMIDEFQDTSRFQYENFKPLLREALGAGGDSVIVGDVKQSIYRFRNSDPTLLQSTLAADFTSYQELHNLIYNWRSAPAIVSFNNRFFSLLSTSSGFQTGGLAHLLHHKDSLVCQVYSPEEVHQEIPPAHRQKPGGVFIHHCLEFRGEPSSQDQTSALDKLQRKIDYLLDTALPAVLARGYQLSDIAILAPKNDTLQSIAWSIIERNRTKSQHLAFVSREMLTLDANPLYRLVIDILRSIVANAGTPEEIYSQSFEHRLAVAHLDQLARSVTSGEGQLPTFDFSRCYQEGQSASLYELFILILELLKPLSTSADQPYMDALLDSVQDYSQDNYADLQGFLEWLDHHTPKLSLQAQDALQLLTIHSAKGLGFPVVFLLEYQMGLLETTDTIWCEGQQVEPIIRKLLGEGVEIPQLLPIAPSKAAQATPFRPFIIREQTSSLLDRINALYVAMTRAKSEMHLLLEDGNQETGKRVNFELLVSQLVSEISETARSEGDRKEIPLLLSEETIETESIAGTLQTFLAEGCSLPEVHELPPSASLSSETYKAVPRDKSEGRLAAMHVRRFQSISYQNDAVRRGIFLHTLLSEIDYLDSPSEWRKALQTKALQGFIPQEDIEELAVYIERALTDPMIAEYYQRSGRWQVVNERSIVQGSRILRPDRIMYDAEARQAVIIDYKTGDEAMHYTTKHSRQLRLYRQALLKGGFRSARAYILYLTSEGGRVVEVS